MTDNEIEAELKALEAMDPEQMSAEQSNRMDLLQHTFTDRMFDRAFPG